MSSTQVFWVKNYLNGLQYIYVWIMFPILHINKVESRSQLTGRHMNSAMTAVSGYTSQRIYIYIKYCQHILLANTEVISSVFTLWSNSHSLEGKERQCDLFCPTADLW
jgi:hypothetical protein